MSSKDDLIIGIDLGTTNSLVAVCDEKGSRVFKDGESSLIPSVLVFNEQGKVLAVGQRAKTLKSLDPKRVLYSVKRLMGKGKKDIESLPFKLPFDFSPSTNEVVRIQMGPQKYSPIELSAEVLKRCKFIAENALGRPVKKAVITVPAYFNDGQRSATAMAGKLAGLQVVRILNEPTAAALAYGFGKSNTKDSKMIAVYDFGGGTFDISILKVTGKIFEVLSTDGDTMLGGDDLDHAIAHYLEKKSNCHARTEEDRVLLLSQAENIKKALSSATKVAVQLHWSQKLQWSGQISREEIDSVMKAVVERTVSSCKNALKAANVSVGNIDEVVMVGGSTRVPLVRSMVKEFFKKTPNTSLNPDEVVAIGAAIQASILSGETTDALLLDVVPLSLGLETMGGVVSKIIPRNSTIPCAASEMFTTYADNQTAVDLHILQGERELVKDCRSLGKFKLRIPPGPAGLPKIEVQFLMDANGILQVKALDKKTGESAALEVSPSFGLSDAEVEAMLQAALENVQKDFAERQLIEATNQARALIQATEKSLKNPLLDSAFKALQEQKIRPVVKALQIDLESAVLEIILTRTKELDFITQDLAQAILNQSVSSHLAQRSIESIGG